MQRAATRGTARCLGKPIICAGDPPERSGDHVFMRSPGCDQTERSDGRGRKGAVTACGISERAVVGGPAEEVVQQPSLL